MSIPENDNDARTSAPPAAPLKEPPPAAPAHGVDDAAQQRRRGVSRWLGAGLVLALIVIVALAAALRHQQQQLDNFGREATRRLNDVATQVEEARAQSAQAAGQVANHEARVAQIDERLRRAEEQQGALAEFYREWASGNDEAMLVDVEQSLLLAAEQLQWTGRIPSAIAALQLAEARLARAGRPGFLSAQQAIARDMHRLQGLPAPNVSQISARIERLMAQVDELPLAAGSASAERREEPVAAEAAQEPASPPVAADAPWWERAWAPVRDWSAGAREATITELRDLVSVRRIESPDALLMAPEQGAWLRTNVKLRLTEARIALLAREAGLWRADLQAAIDAVSQYADPEAPATTRMLRQLESLAEIDPAPELPDLAESLAAVRALLARAGNDTLDAQASGG